MEVLKRLELLRNEMKKAHIDIYIIPTDDFHLSEYVGDYFKCREYMSGFTGSAGVMAVTEHRAGLWTDGRYFLQAEQQLAGTGIELFRMGTDDVPGMDEYVEQHLKKGMTLGFDGRCMAASVGCGYLELVERCGNTEDGHLIYQTDLVGEIWNGRPSISREKAFVLNMEYAGESYESKLAKVRNDMEEKGADLCFLTALDEIAWLLNIRGNDVKCNPVLLSYLIVSKEEAVLYCFEESITEIRYYLEGLGIEIRDYFSVYDEIREYGRERRVLTDTNKVNYTLYMSLVKNNAKILDYNTPVYLLKAVKNKTEVENERQAHLKDAIAYIRFLYWFKTHLGKQYMDELTVAERLLQERKKMEHFIEESFDSIVAYGEHGAIVHYSASEDTKYEIHPSSFVLIDTGAHYLEGTTDITRTLVCGTLTERQKKHYTAVLKGNLNLGGTRFLYGVNGLNLDVLARQPLWEMGLDYNHGTGHGVGYLLNVHEGPNAFRWRISEGKKRVPKLEEGMITSNEPGVYLKDEYGIRLENMVVCRRSEDYDTNPFGHFMEFETLTLVPFEREAIVAEDLTGRERELLNDYHARVYETVSPYLNREEQEFLKRYTEPL